MSDVAAPPLVPEQALADFVREQRWFGFKSSELAGTRMIDAAQLRDASPRLVDALVDVTLGPGTHETYQLVLGVTEGEPSGPPIDTSGDATVYEAVADPSFIRELFHLMRGGANLPTPDGALEFGALGPAHRRGAQLRLGATARARADELVGGRRTTS